MNGRLLIEKAQRRGVALETIAERIREKNLEDFMSKLYSQSEEMEFTVSQIRTIKAMISLDADEVDRIFFDMDGIEGWV